MRPIIAAPSATYQQVFANLQGDATDLFCGPMLDAIWTAGEARRVDPVGMAALSRHETNGGRFTGRVPAWFRNLCGLKVPDPGRVMAALGVTDPDHTFVHAQFADWETAAFALADHLCAYCAISVPSPTPDPRWHLVWGRHQIRYWSDLDGRWAGLAGRDYGTKVEADMDWIGATP